MWILVIAALALTAVAAFWLGYLPPPHATTLIRIGSNGCLRIRRGRLQTHAKEGVSEILRDAGVSHGFIAISPKNRVTFSRNIPPAFHQRLRNVLVNQWA